MKKILTKKIKKGFSLLEVIVALFILSIGITGMLSLIVFSINNSRESRDIIVASQLAQEGIELVRNRRDSNVIANPSDVFLGMDANDDCRIDPVMPIANAPACSQTVFVLNQAATGGIYRFVHSAGTATKFSRKIIIEELSPEERLIRSLVYWGSTSPANDGGDCSSINNCAYAETILTSWGQE